MDVIQLFVDVLRVLGAVDMPLRRWIKSLIAHF